MDGLEEAISYFKEMVTQGPNPISQYELGMKLAVELKEVIGAGFFNQKDFDEYLSKLESLDSPGSMYFWLWQYTVRLGYEAGLVVPKDHIWGNPNKGKLMCLSSDQYESSLIPGRWYELLDSQSKPGFVRVVAEKSKHRWLPEKLFDIKPPKEREYEKKP